MGFAVPTLAACFQMWSPHTPVIGVPSSRDAGQIAGPDPSPQLPSRALLAPGPGAWLIIQDQSWGVGVQGAGAGT